MLQKIANTLYTGYEYLLTKEILGNPVPSHIAIIQDGNRRYAAKLDKPSYYGHFYGANTTEKVMDWCLELGIRQLTIYALSTENFSRPYSERIPLFKLFKKKFDEICVDERVHRDKMQIRVIGNIDLLPQDLRLAAKRAERITQQYENFRLNVALAYGGRWELLDVVKAITKNVEIGVLKAKDIDQDTISDYLYSNGSPTNVDLIIRTGGEKRMSNFLPWQASGNECAAYFCAPYWPEFRKIDFLRAIRTYQMRDKEKRSSTVLRAISLLMGCVKIELEDALESSKRALKVTRRDMVRRLKGLRSEE
ncbi:MAG: polyprenyl diphosphate synthase [Methanocellales archaeon]|nr:polyprenyl diphosphate synthase [Methanocellales archaeon]MDD3421102.1 polyprenyl diphosphate synthase [Methanocellales archaeon]MDD4898360.1 polyprenyl diphosphate synthase [Methanocellales archaeon]MDD5446720.1 polyprenyl diphosphate synthase [Methanocellales archaeon]